MYIWCNVPIFMEPDILSAMMQVDAMINGRRRDHGAERAHLEVVEAGAMAKIQPIAYWEFRFVLTTFTSGFLVVALLYFSCFMCSAYSVCR
jgi:3'-phosphoadenosine 5'-phosphosulfate sulfotransferase (PAPS reductase)/FAD synthetase